MRNQRLRHLCCTLSSTLNLIQHTLRRTRVRKRPRDSKVRSRTQFRRFKHYRASHRNRTRYPPRGENQRCIPRRDTQDRPHRLFEHETQCIRLLSGWDRASHAAYLCGDLLQVAYTKLDILRRPCGSAGCLCDLGGDKRGCVGLVVRGYTKDEVAAGGVGGVPPGLEGCPGCGRCGFGVFGGGGAGVVDGGVAGGLGDGDGSRCGHGGVIDPERNGRGGHGAARVLLLLRTGLMGGCIGLYFVRVSLS